MTETHYDDDAVISALADPKETELRGRMEAHALSCAECAARLQSVTEMIGTFSSAAAWIEQEPVLAADPPPLLVASFQREAARKEEEEDEARPHMALLESAPNLPPAEVLAAGLPQTAGAVRILLSAADRHNDDDPPRALRLADTAIALLEGLPVGIYPGEMNAVLTGLAWKERGKALRMLGRFPEASEDLERASRCLEECAAGAFELAGVGLARAMIYRETGRLSESARLATESAETYLRFGDHQRHRVARTVEGAVRYSAGDIAGARDLFLSLVASARAEGDIRSLTHLFTNIALCCGDLGEFEAAATWYHQALAVIRESGNSALMAYPRWGLARMLIAAGKMQEGLERLREAEADFAARGVVLQAAFVSLEAADILLLLGRYDEVTESCRRLIGLFQSAAVTTSAVTALAYLREAAANRSLTADVIVHVRQHLQRLPAEPHLLFLPP